MKRGSSVMMIGALCFALFCGAESGGQAKQTSLLFDGYALNGAEGALVGPVDAGEWFFELEMDVTDGKAVVEAGTRLELLRSSGLERLVADANESKSRSYRLWGRVTKYKGRNFVFPMQYLALDGAGVVKAAEPPEEKIEEQADPSPAEANDTVSLPVEVLEKLRSRQVIRTEQLRRPLDIRQDSILADRMGYLSRAADERVFFTLDSLGRNAPWISFELLRCEALERAEVEDSRDAEQLRMKAAGVLTKYEGRYYLLLQRANRVYGHGNFGR
jgi:hypothetical protein